MPDEVNRIAFEHHYQCFFEEIYLRSERNIYGAYKAIQNFAEVVETI
jgi:hypothetical protein